MVVIVCEESYRILVLELQAVVGPRYFRKFLFLDELAPQIIEKESVADGAEYYKIPADCIDREIRQIQVLPRAVSFFVKRELETSLPVENEDLGSSIIMDIISVLKKLDLGYITDQRFRRCLQWDDLDIGEQVFCGDIISPFQIHGDDI